MSERVISPVITQAGIAATMAAVNSGMKVRLTHVALGAGKLVGAVRTGYAPTGTETALAYEFGRYQIGQSENLSGNEIALSVLCDGPAQGWVKEIGYFTDDNTLFAVWSEPTAALFYKQNGVPMASVFTLALFGLPADSVQMIVGAPSVNLTIIGAFAGLTAELTRLQRRAIETEIARLSPSITGKWFG